MITIQWDLASETAELDDLERCNCIILQSLIQKISKIISISLFSKTPPMNLL